MSDNMIKLRFQGKTSPCSAPELDRKDPVPVIKEAPWITGTLETTAGKIPVAATELSFSDTLGTWRARWGIGRMRYIVAPGLYAVGRPTAESPLLASANYKMSFDRLRSALKGLDAWVLVLDTRGINVWCAAGKGTFGTEELAGRLAGVSDIVSHRTVVLPQLGAPGVSAHEVRRMTGFRVVYGPVRAADLPDFLSAGMKATAEMRRVRFPLGDRLVLVPMEMIPAAKYALPLAVALFFLSGLSPDGYSLARAGTYGTLSAALLLAAFVAGTVVSPALLPWIPGRAFSLKGALAGAALASPLWAFAWVDTGAFTNLPSLVSWGLIVPAVSSFFAMNFTGASTYTSLSGVKREMRFAVPLQAGGALAGLGLWIAGLFI